MKLVMAGRSTGRLLLQQEITGSIPVMTLGLQPN
jgi:hypothetical protein